MKHKPIREAIDNIIGQPIAFTNIDKVRMLLVMPLEVRKEITNQLELLVTQACIEELEGVKRLIQIPDTRIPSFWIYGRYTEEEVWGQAQKAQLIAIIGALNDYIKALRGEKK